jgi:hypothetical protein
MSIMLLAIIVVKLSYLVDIARKQADRAVLTRTSGENVDP